MRRALPVLAAALLACTPRPGRDGASVDPATVGKSLKPGFLLGTATASHQTEGGLTNTWTAWEQSTSPEGKPRIKGNQQSGRATDSWNQFDVDLGLMKTLGANAYRFSIEWSRLEPTRGQFDAAAFARYRSWCQQLRAQGLTPMVTLQHFSLPTWAGNGAGWEDPQIVADLEAFTRRAARELGGEVDLWITVNEPNVQAFSGFLTGEFPPGKTSQRGMVEAIAMMLRAHGAAAAALREEDTVDADGDGRATLIGLAHHVRTFQPASPSTFDTGVAAIADDVFNEAIPRAVRTGRFTVNIIATIDFELAVPQVRDSVDFWGLNFYTRDYVRADLGDPSLSKQFTPAGRPVNDLGWDLVPDAFAQALERVAAYGKPVYVTENGLADAAGTLRPQYLAQHLAVVEQAVRDGLDVRGYLHWSLLDNFEWAQGFTPRFGLFSVDYQSPTLARSPTPAVETFRAVARNLGLTPTP